MEPDFSTGQIVYLKADPNRRGPIIEVLSPVGGRYRYRVFHTSTEIREYYAEQLCSLRHPTSEGNEVRTIFDFPLLPADEFRTRLIAARLAHPLTDNLYMLHAARIKFIPFQFKPLLRLLRADRPRILIADEVGVGKTIEAGLILKELQARQRLENVLIVCPKALVTKWRAEMRRFDEDFSASHSRYAPLLSQGNSVRRCLACPIFTRHCTSRIVQKPGLPLRHDRS